MTMLKLPMRDALRLIRDGKVSEATTLIRSALGRKREPKQAPVDQAPSPIDVEFEVIDPVSDVSRRAASSIWLPAALTGHPVSDDGTKAATDAAERGAARSQPIPPAWVPARDRGGADGTFEPGVYANAAGLRSYKLWAPAEHPAHGSRVPLVVMLHGCTQDADDFALGTRMNAYAGREGCYVLYPNQSAAANFKRCWQWFRPEDQHRDAGEPSILAEMTASIVKDHPIDPARVFVAGLSAGAAMAVILGRTYPDIFAAVASHSGLPFGSADSVPSAMAAMSGQARSTRRASPKPDRSASPRPGIAIHGDRDATVVPANSEALVAQWQQAYADSGQTGLVGEVVNGKGARCERLRDSRGQVVIEQWTIPGGGHAWSGGDARGTYASATGPDASRLILDFFLQVGGGKIG